jgi:hypothetical protein
MFIHEYALSDSARNQWMKIAMPDAVLPRPRVAGKINKWSWRHPGSLAAKSAHPVTADDRCG